MKEFKNLAELKADKELQTMSRYGYAKVKLYENEVIACRTNQGYEDIIWGGAYNLLDELRKKYCLGDIDIDDLASMVRDSVLDILDKEYKIRFVDVFDEY